MLHWQSWGAGGARVTLHWQSWGESKGYATLTTMGGSKSYATLTIMGEQGLRYTDITIMGEQELCYTDNHGGEQGLHYTDNHGEARVTLHWQSWGGGTRVTLHWQSQCLWPDPNPDTASPAFLEQPSHWTVHGCWGHSGGSWPWPRSACGQETR